MRSLPRSSRRPRYITALRAAGVAVVLLPTAVTGIARAHATPLEPTAVVRLEAVQTAVPLRPGPPTEMLRYRATVESGPASVLDSIPGSYLGPIFRVRQGDRLRVRFVNQTGEPSIVHWHGLVIPDSADGHPRFAIGDGEERIYDFSVLNRAGTYWYHPHPHMLTGPQVIRGLAGLFLVSDGTESSLPLPRGERDVPLVIQDRSFDEFNQIRYDHDQMEGGHWGEEIFVNGRPDYVLSAATRVYRLRLLNGSVSRMYKLAWSDGTPMTVIGTDGGLLEAPEERPYVMLAPAERAEIWLDLGGRPVGSEVILQSLAFDPGGMEHPASLPNGAPFDVMRITVDRAEAETLTLPDVLTPFERYQIQDAVNAGSPRAFPASRMMGQWLLNGRVFEMEEVAANEIVRTGDLEVWELINTSGMNQMRMAHPIHLHGVQFQIIQRTMAVEGAPAWSTVNEGLVDEGWKDTFLMMPGEKVRFLVRFGPYPGLYLYHCHNLLHEDGGMMRNYRVEPNPADGPDPTGRDAGLELHVPGAWRGGAPVAIRYAAPDHGPASLRVFDVAGRCVRRLELPPGVVGEPIPKALSEISWDLRTDHGRRVTSGVYLIRLAAGGPSISKRLVVVR